MSNKFVIKIFSNVTFHISSQTNIKIVTFVIDRHDKRRGPTPSGARIPHAVSAELPRGALRDHAGVLAQGPAEKAHVRDPAVEAGGLLHHGQLRVQGGVRLLSPALPAAPPTRTLASCKLLFNKKLRSRGKCRCASATGPRLRFKVK